MKHWVATAQDIAAALRVGNSPLARSILDASVAEGRSRRALTDDALGFLEPYEQSWAAEALGASATIRGEHTTCR